MNSYICYIGRPSYQKNTLFLIDVVDVVRKVLSGVKFLLLGVGYYSPELEQVENKIKELGLSENIELKTWLSHVETLRIVKDSMFYLTVARYEGLPLSVIEAMSLGKAIVASDVVGNKDCIVNDYNWYLLPLDVQIFSEHIIQLVNDKELRTKFETNSRKLFEEKFLIDNRIAELERIYREI